MQPSTNQDRTPPRSSYIALDLARATAALIVFLSHVRGSSFVEFGALPQSHQGLPTKVLFALTRLGHEAVLLFFVLSGFLVGGQVIRHLKARRFDVKTYALERATRILLPLVPACLLTATIAWLLSARPPDWLQVIGNMIGLNGIFVDTLLNNAPLWSLAYEIWFYVIAGAIGVILARGAISWLAIALLMCSAFIFTMLELRYLLFWCLGALSILLVDKGFARSLAAIGAIAVATGTIAYQLGIQSKSGIQMTLLPTPMAEALIAIGMCVTLPYLCKLDHQLAGLRRVAVYLSSLSYTLYLIHYPINEALTWVLPRSPDLSWWAIALFGIRAAMIFSFAHLFFLAFEANTVALRRFLSARIFSR